MLIDTVEQGQPDEANYQVHPHVYRKSDLAHPVFVQISKEHDRPDDQPCQLKNWVQDSEAGVPQRQSIASFLEAVDQDGEYDHQEACGSLDEEPKT